jgi:hypothetical protein
LKVKAAGLQLDLKDYSRVLTVPYWKGYSSITTGFEGLQQGYKWSYNRLDYRKVTAA